MSIFCLQKQQNFLCFVYEKYMDNFSYKSNSQVLLHIDTDRYFIILQSISLKK